MQPSSSVHLFFHTRPLAPLSNPLSQTEQDFAAIAAAGLNYVRIPLPYWAIEVWDGEPFEPKAAWTCVFLFKTLPCSQIFTLLSPRRQVLPQGYRMGSQIRPPHQPRLPLPPRLSKRMESLRQAGYDRCSPGSYGHCERTEVLGLYSFPRRVHLARPVQGCGDDVRGYERAAG